MNSSLDVIYFKDRQSRFIAGSSSLTRRFGIASTDQLIGRTDDDFFSDELARTTFADEQKLMETGVPINGKLEKETWKDGRLTWALVTKMPLRDESGNIIGLFGINKDITELKNAEEALEKSQRDLIDASRLLGRAEVATSVLHSAGNLLSSVNTSALVITEKLRVFNISGLSKAIKLLQDNSGNLPAFLTEDSKGRLLVQYLGKLATALDKEHQILLSESESLERKIERMAEIISLQQQNGSPKYRSEKLALDALVEDVLRLCYDGLAREHIVLFRQFEPVPPVAGVRHLVTEILMELISNARTVLSKADQKERNIAVTIRREEKEAIVSVSDNGPGMGPELLKDVFGFDEREAEASIGYRYALHNSAISAKQMRGRLTASSLTSGQGSTFSLHLPYPDDQNERSG
ncbi:MAG: PAS domain-containing protein [Nibricoccus sp.]